MFIARQHRVSCRGLYRFTISGCLRLSVCSPVSPSGQSGAVPRGARGAAPSENTRISVELCRQTFVGRAIISIILLSETNQRSRIPRVTPQRGRSIHGHEKNAKSPFITLSYIYKCIVVELPLWMSIFIYFNAAYVALVFVFLKL